MTTYRELKGTEKQIEWANSLRISMLCRLTEIEDGVACAVKKRPELANDPSNKAMIAALPVVREQIMAQESAVWFIDNREDAKKLLANMVKVEMSKHI